MLVKIALTNKVKEQNVQLIKHITCMLLLDGHEVKQ